MGVRGRYVIAPTIPRDYNYFRPPRVYPNTLLGIHDRHRFRYKSIINMTVRANKSCSKSHTEIDCFQTVINATPYRPIIIILVERIGRLYKKKKIKRKNKNAVHNCVFVWPLPSRTWRGVLRENVFSRVSTCGRTRAARVQRTDHPGERRLSFYRGVISSTNSVDLFVTRSGRTASYRAPNRRGGERNPRNSRRRRPTTSSSLQSCPWW